MNYGEEDKIMTGLHLTDRDQARPGDRCRLCGMVAEASKLCTNGIGWRGQCPGPLDRELGSLERELSSLKARWADAYRRREVPPPGGIMFWTDARMTRATRRSRGGITGM